MLRIGIDVSRTVGKPTGVGWYTRQLVRGLAAVDAENEYSLYPFFWHCHPPEFHDAGEFIANRFSVQDMNRSFEELRERWVEDRYPARELLGDIDLLHSPAYTAPYLSEMKLVVTIHDLSFLTHPHFHTMENRRFCTIQSLRASRRADAIIAVSEATACDIRRYLHVTSDRLFVIPEAAGPEYRRIDDPELLRPTLLSFGIRENFILFVGTVEPRKNLEALIEAFSRVKRRTHRPEWLIIAGGSGWKNEEIYARVRELGLTGSVRFLGYVSTEQLVALYNSCRLFVYPSLYEGFGLPILEAMACGAPVITSNISSLPEVAGSAARTVDPLNIEAIADSIEDLLTDSAARSELRGLGLQRAGRYSWEETARRTIKVYEEIADQ